MPSPQCCYGDSGTVSWGCNGMYEVTWSSYDCIEGAEFLGEWPPLSCTGTGGTRLLRTEHAIRSLVWGD